MGNLTFDDDWLAKQVARSASWGGNKHLRHLVNPQPPGAPKAPATSPKSASRSRKSSNPESPHKIALRLLQKKPELESGNREHYSQVRIFSYFEDTNRDIYDRLAAVPNGGSRSKAAAGKMRAEGQKSGYPDLIFDVARGRYFGLRVEVKVKGGKLSDAQEKYGKRLIEDGYCWRVVWSTEEAIQLLEAYWALPKYDGETTLEIEG